MKWEAIAQRYHLGAKPRPFQKLDDRIPNHRTSGKCSSHCEQHGQSSKAAHNLDNSIADNRNRLSERESWVEQRFIRGKLVEQTICMAAPYDFWVNLCPKEIQTGPLYLLVSSFCQGHCTSRAWTLQQVSKKKFGQITWDQGGYESEVQKSQGDGVLKSIVTGIARQQKKSRTLPGVSLASSNYFVDSPWVVVGEAFVCQTACLDRIEYLELSCDGTSETQNLLLQLRWRTKSNCSYHKHRRPCSWEGELRVVNYTFWINKHFREQQALIFPSSCQTVICCTHLWWA